MMSATMQTFVTWALTTLIGAFVGSFLGAYLKKKGEDLAIREGFKNLLTQVTATTEATKAIEARISSKVWNQQKQWELKRDVLFDLIRAVTEFNSAYWQLSNLGAPPSAGVSEQLRTKWHGTHREAVDAWNTSMDKIRSCRSLALLVCDQATEATLNSFDETIRSCSIPVLAGAGFDAFLHSRPLMEDAFDKLIIAIRRELQVIDDGALISTGSGGGHSSP
jgi:hypothetical protein